MLDETAARGVDALREAAKDAAYRCVEVRCVLALYVGLLVFYAPSTPPAHLAAASVAMVAGLWLWAEHLARRLADVLVAHARTFCDRFFTYYNLEHRHSGIGLHTPADVHHGRHHAVRARRQTVLDTAYAAHPERFRRPPTAPTIPDVAWINRPTEPELDLSQIS